MSIEYINFMLIPAGIPTPKGMGFRAAGRKTVAVSLAFHTFIFYFVYKVTTFVSNCSIIVQKYTRYP